MARSRASKGLLVPPQERPVPDANARIRWLAEASSGFDATPANRAIYEVILTQLWPGGHGVPGPQISELEIRAAVNAFRAKAGKRPYVDVFRRLRELQGDQGFTSIIKEGTKYQLVSLGVGPKRERRAKPPGWLWKQLLEQSGYRCAHCGERSPGVKLSPDHRIPRSRNGTNEDSNWQPLCEQCNNAKSSACQGCGLNCSTCFWAYPEDYKPIVINDYNRERIRREAARVREDQSHYANEILRQHFQKEGGA